MTEPGPTSSLIGHFRWLWRFLAWFERRAERAYSDSVRRRAARIVRADRGFDVLPPRAGRECESVHAGLLASSPRRRHCGTCVRGECLIFPPREPGGRRPPSR